MGMHRAAPSCSRIPPAETPAPPHPCLPTGHHRAWILTLLTFPRSLQSHQCQHGKSGEQGNAPPHHTLGYSTSPLSEGQQDIFQPDFTKCRLQVLPCTKNALGHLQTYLSLNNVGLSTGSLQWSSLIKLPFAPILFLTHPLPPLQRHKNKFWASSIYNWAKLAVQE